MKLIPDWTHAWRFFCVIGAAALAIANVVHANTDILAALFPPKTWAWINVLSLIGIAVGRVLQQQIPARDGDVAATEPAAPAIPKESS